MRRVRSIGFILFLFLPFIMKGQMLLNSGGTGSINDQGYSIIIGTDENNLKPGFNNCTFTPLITGPASACVGSTSNVYGTDPGGSGYIWSISAGGIITSGTGTNTITVTWNTAGAQTVSVDFTNSSGCTSNPYFYPVTINPNLPVSVSISASGNPVCQGDMVTFTATPVNGGSSPSYQWKVNNISVGTNSSAYTYTPTNLDQVICILTSNEACKTGDPATSNPIDMIVNPGLPVSVTIAASANPICQGTSVTFTATPVNGGSSPAYQWKVNGLNVGTNNPVYSYTPLNADVVTCELNSNETCATGNPAISNQVIMAVSPILPVSVTIAASPSGTVCDGTLVTYTASPVNGGSAPSYQWKVNGINAGTNNAQYSYTPVNGDVVNVVMTSNAPCASGNPATSNALTMTVTPNLPVDVTIAVSANPVCQSSSVIFTATPVNGGSSPAFQWIVNGFSVGTNSPTFTYTPSNTDAVLCYLMSSETCTSNNPAISNTVIMTVDPNLPVSVSITASANPVCEGTIVTFSATPTNGGSSPVYQWKVNGTNAGTNSSTYAYAPVNGDLITCILNSNATCATGNPATSNPITMTVSPNLPVSVSISSSSNPVCQGNSVTFTATPVNGGSFPIYQWKVNGVIAGGFGSTYTYAPVNGDVVTCRLTSNINCATGNPAMSNTITMVVSPGLSVSVTIAASSNPFCQGQAVTFTATPANEGASPVYQWYVNGISVGINSPTYAYVPSNNDNVVCILTSSFSCATGNPATSNLLLMSSEALLPVSVSISASANPSCPGQSVTYTATSVNGGSSPSYQWKVNGINVGANSSTYSYIPANGDIIRCQLTSSGSCVSGNPANSNQIIATVSTVLPVSVTISASTNFICQGTPVTFTAIPVNGGSSPVYQWFVNGIPAGTNSPVFTYTPSSGDVITCQLTSSLTCASGNPAMSNPITMSVYAYGTVSVVITASANPACQGFMVTFTAIPTNGGSTPAYQWKVNGVNAGTNSSTFTYTPANGDVISCILTSNYLCPLGNPATSNTIIMTILPNLAVGVTITASANPICETIPITFTATPTNGGLAPVFQWFVNGIPVGTNSPTYTYIPANGDIISCVLNSNVACGTGNPATSNSIVMVVNPNLPVSVLITASANPICGSIPVTFTASPTNGGSSPVYQWAVNGINVGTNSSTYTYTPANGDIITCVLTSNAICATGSPATSNTIIMVVNPNLPVSITITASANPVCQGTAVTFTATPVNGGSSPSYQWEVNGVNVGINSSSYTYTPINGDVIICVLTSNAICATGNPATSNAVVMVVSSNLPVSVTITASANPVCLGTAVTFIAIPINEGLVPVYEWRVNGIHVGTNSPTYTYTPANGDVILCRLTSDLLCATGNPALSNQIVMTVDPYAVAGIFITASANPVCQGTQVTYTATPVNGGASPSYQWSVNGIISGSNSPMFTYTPANGDVITCRMTSDYLCSIGGIVTSNPITMIVIPNLPVSVTITSSADPVCQGAAVTFTATPGNGGSSPVYQWRVNGIIVGTNSSTYTYTPADGDAITCVLNSNVGCATGNPATSNTIILTVNPVLPVSVSIAASANPVCTGTLVTFTATPVNGGISPAYQWLKNGILVPGVVTNTYTPASLTDGDQVSCILTSNAICASGNPATSPSITMTVSAILPVSVSISANPSGPVCANISVTFTAIPVDGGSSPSYQWTKNGIPILGEVASTYFASSLTNKDLIRCILTSSLMCTTGNPATSNGISINILSIPAVNFTLCNTVTTHDAAPFILSQGIPLGGTYTGTGVVGNTFDPSLVPPGQNTVTINYSYTNTNGCTVSASQLITLFPSSGGFVCGQTLTDVRDNQTYTTQLIGSQCWFAQNLNYGTFISSVSFQSDNCISEKYCFSDVPGNCTLNGGLYQWDEVMQYNTSQGVQGLCPPGWHIPTEAEWSVLESTQNGAGNAGGFLKSTGTSGFNALLSGVIYSKTTWKFQNFASLFWTSSSFSTIKAISHGLNQKVSSVSDYNASRLNAFSVRCLKN